MGAPAWGGGDFRKLKRSHFDFVNCAAPPSLLRSSRVSKGQMAAEDRNPLDVAGDEDEAKSASAAGDAEAKAADVGPTKSAYEIAEERGEQRAHLKIDEHKARQATPTSVRVLLSAEAKDGGNFGTCLRSIEAHGLGDGYVEDAQAVAWRVEGASVTDQPSAMALRGRAGGALGARWGRAGGGARLVCCAQQLVVRSRGTKSAHSSPLCCERALCTNSPRKMHCACLCVFSRYMAAGRLPLMVFKGSIDLSLDVEVLKRSPYCLEKLDGEWKEKSAVEFSFGSLNLAEAFRDAFDSLSGSMPTIRTANQFHLYSAASTLGIDDLQKHCEKFVTLNIFLH